MPTWLRWRFLACERGSISIFLVIILPLLLVIGGVATDISLLNGQKKHVQGQADMAAQSAVMFLPDLGAVRAAATRVARDNDRFGAPDLQFGDIVVGSYTRAGGFVASNDQNSAAGVNAVRVVVPSPFQPMLLDAVLRDEDLTIRREAVAAQQATVVFSLRNKLLGLKTKDSILGPILRDTLNVDLRVLGYEGLANADIPIDRLLGLVTADTDVNLLTFADVLDANIFMDDLLSDVLGVVTTSPTGQMLKLGDLLAVSPELARVFVGDVLPDVTVNALDLLTVTAQLAGARKNQRIGAGLDLKLAPLATIALDAGAIRPAKTVIGIVGDNPPSRASVDQIDIGLETNVLQLGTPLLHLKLGVKVASAHATPVSLNCNASGPTERLAIFDVTTAPAGLGLDLNLLGAGSFEPSRHLAPSSIAPVSRSVPITKAQEGTWIEIANPILLDNLLTSLGGMISGIRSDTQHQRDQCGILGLGCLVSGLLGSVLGILGGLVTSLGTLVGNLVPLNTALAGILDALGIKTAQADLMLHSYSCGPALVR